MPVPDTPLALDPEARDGVIAAIGGPGNDLPPLLRPVMRGDGSVIPNQVDRVH